MGFFRNINSKPTPKEVARDRLKLILIHDRGDIDPETIDKIRVEILQVLSKYIEIEADDVEIALNRTETNESGNGPALVANIPIKSKRGR